MKKILAILLAVVMTLSMITPVFAASYSDTAENDYEAAIEHLSGLGVINGYEDGSFQPEKIVTRAEMAKLLIECLGLGEGADILQNATYFDDVEIGKWDTGYIGMAYQAGLIKGDGDGNFRPTDTVNYAEVVTMCLRALGYQSMVEKNGEWPTNYLNRAREFSLFDDVEYTALSGANRGSVAKIMWNMLNNVDMWDIINENETNGANIGISGKTMLETKYPNFVYSDELKYTGYAITNDGEDFKVELTLDDGDVTTDDIYEYEGNDFYMLPTGITVEALGDLKADKIISMFVTDDQYVAEGTKKEVKDSHINSDIAGTYGAVALGSDAKSAARLAGSVSVDIDGIVDTKVIEDITVGTKTTKITYEQATGMTNDSATSFKTDDAEEIISKGLYIIDGERTTIADLKVGDVITQVGVPDATIDADDLYVVSREKVVGSYDELVNEKVIGSTYAAITVDGKDYDFTTAFNFANATPINDFVYDEDKDGESVTVDWADFKDEDEDDNKYLGEDMTVLFNAFGDAVKVLFGNIDDIATKGSLYLLPGNDTWSVSDSEGAIEYVKLIDEVGTKNYVISEANAAAVKAIVNDAANKGAMVYAEFNADDEVTKLTLISTLTFDGTTVAATALNLQAAGVTYVTADMTDPDAFEAVAKPAASLDKDTNYLGAYKITSDTVVFTLKQTEDEDNAGKYLKKFTVEITSGPAELKNVDAAKTIVFTEDGESVKAQYVVVLGTSVSDAQYGIIEAITINGSKTYYTISGEKYEKGTVPGTPAVGNIVVYTLSDGKVNIANTGIFGSETLKGNDYKVTNVDGELITVNVGTPVTFDLDLIAQEETTGGQDFADFRVVKATVDYDDLNGDGNIDADNESYFDSIEEIGLDEISTKKDNGFVINTTNKLVIVISGYDR